MNDNSNFILFYSGPTKGHSYDRFLVYCKNFGISVSIIKQDDNVFHINTIIREINSWSYEKMRTTLIMIILMEKDADCTIIPLASVSEIIAKYIKISTIDNKKITENIKRNYNIIVSDFEKNSRNIFLCTMAENVVDLWINRISKILELDNENYDNEKINIVSDLVIGVSIESLITNNVIHDNQCEMFNCLDTDPNVIIDDDVERIINSRTNTEPCFFYSFKDNSVSKLNQIENYTKNNLFDKENDVIELSSVYVAIKKNEHNYIMLDNLNYPKELLFFENNELDELSENENFYQNSIKNFLDTNCDYYFLIDGDAIITNPNVLKELIKFNKDVTTPLICRKNSSWSNFWGALDENGYYDRSFDYFDIVSYEKKGCWNVPYIASVYLIKRNVIELVPNLFTDNDYMDIDMRICFNLRKRYFYVSLQHK